MTDIIIGTIIATCIGFTGGFILGYQTHRDLTKMIRDVFKKEGNSQ